MTYQICTCSPRGVDGGPDRDCPIHGEQPETTTTTNSAMTDTQQDAEASAVGERWHFLDKRSKALARNHDGLKLEFATHSDAVLGRRVLEGYEADHDRVQALERQLEQAHRALRVWALRTHAGMRHPIGFDRCHAEVCADARQTIAALTPSPAQPTCTCTWKAYPQQNNVNPECPVHGTPTEGAQS